MAFSRQKKGSGFSRRRRRDELFIPKAIFSLVALVLSLAALYYLYRLFSASGFLPEQLVALLDVLCLILAVCFVALTLAYIRSMQRK